MSNPIRRKPEIDLNNIDALSQFLDEWKRLQQEIPELRRQREELGRFLEIDREVAELARLRREKAETVSSAQAEAQAILEKAHSEARAFLADLERREKAVVEAQKKLREARDRAKVALENILVADGFPSHEKPVATPWTTPPASEG